MGKSGTGDLNGVAITITLSLTFTIWLQYASILNAPLRSTVVSGGERVTAGSQTLVVYFQAAYYSKILGGEGGATGLSRGT